MAALGATPVRFATRARFVAPSHRDSSASLAVSAPRRRSRRSRVTRPGPNPRGKCVSNLHAAADDETDATARDDGPEVVFDFDDFDGDETWDVIDSFDDDELYELNASRSDADADDTYFDSYSHLGIHREMIGDAARTGAYLDAIEAHRPQIEGKVVLDVGCGTGILSMFAARCGAKKVYAVDASNVTRHARRLVKENGFENRIEVIKGKMEDVDLPEKVDVIISEWMGYALLFESMLPSVVDARDRFMAPGGLVLPNEASVKVALMSDKERYDGAVTFWSDVYGLDFSSLAPIAKRDWHTDPPVQTIAADKLVSNSMDAVPPIDCATVPLNDLYEPMAGDVRLVADKDCEVHGLALWFDVDFYGKVQLSTGPAAESTHWYQTVLMFDEPIDVKNGDGVCGTIELEPGYNPGERRSLNIYFNYDVMSGGKEEKTLVEPDDREWFQRWTVQ